MVASIGLMDSANCSPIAAAKSISNNVNGSPPMTGLAMVIRCSPYIALSSVGVVVGCICVTYCLGFVCLWNVIVECESVTATPDESGAGSDSFCHRV